MPTAVRIRLGAAEPRDAVAAFERRELLQPSFRWQDVWQEEHSRAFAVAGVQRLDVLQVFRDEVAAALKEGRDLRDFGVVMRTRLAEKGWWGDIEITDAATGEQRITRFDDRRLRTVFDVNMRQSHAAGRWERIWRGRARKPLVLYRTKRDERVRASHRAWEGLVLPVEHPFWHTHYPPNGWRCRCTAFAVDERDIARRIAAGERINREAPEVQWTTYVNPRTGELAPVPRGVDPGFAYNPGRSVRDAELHDAALRKALAAQPLAAAVAVADAQRDFPAMVAAAAAAFGPWVDQVLESGRALGDMQFVGALRPLAVAALQRRGIEPATAAIGVRDADVLHALRPSKRRAEAALPAGTYRRLPELLLRANALLLERGAEGAGDTLLYVVDLLRDDGRIAKLVLQLDAAAKLAAPARRQRITTNLLRTATVMDPQALRDRARYELLWGTIDE